jgi:hypothetical protein
LPYSLSNNSVSSPLELIYSDVWGPACSTVQGEKYYVSFVDAYSKFIWVYLLRHKFDVFNVFHQFQAKVECALEKKIKTVQTDLGGGEYQKLHSFFNNIGISHRVSYPHTHQQNGYAE